MKSALKFSWTKHLSIALLAITLLLTFATAKIAQELVEQNIEYKFNEEVNREEREIKFDLERYLNILDGINGLFIASNDVTRNDFSDYIRSLNINKNYPGIYGFSYISKVSASDSAVFLINLENELIQAKINEELQKNLSNEAEHFIVNYGVLSEDGLHIPYGYDLRIDPVRREAMESAADSGNAVVSAPLVLSGPEVPGFIITHPIYQRNASIDTPKQRREALVGFVNMAFTYKDLFNEVFREVNKSDLNIHLEDSGKLIYGSLGEKPHKHTEISFTDKKISFVNRNWDLSFYVKEDANKDLINRIPLIVLGAGLIVSAMLAGFIYFLVYSQAKAEKLAEKMMKEFQKSQEKFEMYMDSTSVVAWLKETKTWKYTYINKSFEETFNISKDNIQDKTDFDLFPKEIADVTRTNDVLVFNENKSIQEYENVPLPNGKMRRWLVYKFPITTTDGEKFVGGTAIDVTGQKTFEDELRKNKEELERINNLMVGRELKMIELKNEINELKPKGEKSEENK